MKKNDRINNQKNCTELVDIQTKLSRFSKSKRRILQKFGSPERADAADEAVSVEVSAKSKRAVNSQPDQYNMQSAEKTRFFNSKSVYIFM